MTKQHQILSGLSELISFASVSSNPKNKQQLTDCAAWVKEHLISIGIHHVQIFSTATHPVVFASLIINPAFKTVLFYGHYDVQPPEPLAQWHTAPFNATIEGNYLHGRGASDDKGQLFIHIKAVEQLLANTGTLPVNVKFLIEGAEEIGSTGLKEFISLNKALLACDVVVVSDTKMINEKEPAITSSLRGSLNAEIHIQSSLKDLHSGTFGGAVVNAGLVASNFITRLYKQNGRVNIPGFYEDVSVINVSAKIDNDQHEATKQKFLQDAGAFAEWGEKAFTVEERTTIRPAISVTGISCGYEGAGVKNVIPSSAIIKLNFRLVPQQQPQKVKLLFNQYLQNSLPAYVKTTVSYSSFSNPVAVSGQNMFVAAAKNAYQTVFKTDVKIVRSGGTIAAVDFLYSILKVPVVLMGFAQASDNMHAPNERFYLPNFFRGIETIKQFMKNVSLIDKSNYPGEKLDTSMSAL